MITMAIPPIMNVMRLPYLSRMTPITMLPKTMAMLKATPMALN